MGNRIEVEEKYFIKNIEKLNKIIDSEGFRLVNSYKEIDEYFTDIDSRYIKNRTCLRLRNTNDKELELTFKGKSNEFLNSYAKVEKNIELKIDQYIDIEDMLKKLGYYSYVIVNKTRRTYTKNIEKLTYNIMIDNIEDIGSFVEFEILSEDLNYPLKEIKKKLEAFIFLFEDLNLEVASLPYRDFVAEHIFSKIKPKNKLSTILCDLDGTLINSENIFFESFKEILREKFGICITFSEYEENELIKNSNLINKLKLENKIPDNVLNNDIMHDVYNKYLDKFKELIKDDDVYLNFELLKKIKRKNIKIGLISTSKKEFINLILKDLQLNNLFDIIIAREDVLNLKPNPEAYSKAINTLKINTDECIAIEDSYRGIESSTKANVKTIKINEYSNQNESKENIISIDKISRLLLILINNVEEEINN